MNKDLEKELFKTIKKLDGSLLTVGISNQKVIDEIFKNKKLNRSYNLERRKKRITRKEKNEGYVNIKLRKLGKRFKNKIDYILCDVNGINIYLNSVIDSTYDIVNKQIIFYGIYDSYDVDRIISKYQRYDIEVKKNMYDNNFLLIINTDRIITNWFKKFIYRFIDFFIDFFDAIGTALMK